MDWDSLIYFLLPLMHIPVFTAADKSELNVTFDVWEGSITALWEPPEEASISIFYLVKLALSNNDWQIVPGCNMTTETRCYLGNFLFKDEIYVKIEIMDENGNSSWSIKRVCFSNIKLLAPEFDLSSLSNKVEVKIHRKPILKDLYPFGASYSAILYQRGYENQAITLSEDDDDDEDGVVVFTSLSSWQEYCVRVKVEITSDNVSNTSSPRCIYPATGYRGIFIAVFGAVVVLCTFIFIILACFFMRRPVKMPSALNSAVNGWQPMKVGLVEVETVTDRGWLLTSNRVLLKSKVFSDDKDFLKDDKERRESRDSGVSVCKQDSFKSRNSEEEDSGCGSLTGPEDRRSLEDLPFLGGVVNSSLADRKSEDSGLGIGGQDASDPKSVVGSLAEVVVLQDGYCSQSPSARAEIQTRMKCVEHSQIDHSCIQLAVSCSCSDFGTCVRCKSRISCTNESGNSKLSCLSKSPLQNMNVLEMGDLPLDSDENCNEPLLFITCPLLLQEPYKMETLALTLGDVELTFT